MAVGFPFNWPARLFTTTTTTARRRQSRRSVVIRFTVARGDAYDAKVVGPFTPLPTVGAAGARTWAAVENVGVHDVPVVGWYSNNNTNRRRTFYDRNCCRRPRCFVLNVRPV